MGYIKGETASGKMGKRKVFAVQNYGTTSSSVDLATDIKTDVTFDVLWDNAPMVVTLSRNEIEWLYAKLNAKW